MILALTVCLTWFGPLDPPTPPARPDRPAVKEPALGAELVKRMKADQDARAELMRLSPADSAPTPADRSRPELKAALQKMEAVDRDNLAWLKGVVTKHGWPGTSLVGRDGALGAFLIAQHGVSDLEFMEKCRALLVEAYKAGEAEAECVCLMTDRLRILREKKKQLYGTQLEVRDGKLVPLPIEDEANVDRRRRDLGLPPLADYLRRANAPATPAGRSPAPSK